MIKVVFVCLGNICRSPMAEGMFKRMIEEKGLSRQFIIESRATSSYEIGNPPHHGTERILRRIGVSTKGMYSEKITQGDFEFFDYIVAMDSSNVRNLMAMSDSKYHSKIQKILDIDVPDPYYTLDFDETFELLSEGLNQLWKKVKEEKL